MNNFLGLLQKSIDQDRLLLHHLPQTQHETEPDKKLSTILSASEEGESCSGPGGSSRSSRHYDKYLESSSLEDTFLKPLIDRNTQRAIYSAANHQNRSTITSPRLMLETTAVAATSHES